MQLGPQERQDRFALRRIGRAFSSAFAEAPLGLKSISFEAENALSAATATGQWAQPDCYGLDVAAALFFPLFLLGWSRNLRERSGGRGDLRLLLFWLFGFPVAPNLTFRHRNSPLRRLAGCEHLPILDYAATNPENVEKREGLRGRLPSNVFVQFLAGPKSLRDNLFGVLLRLIAEVILVFGPISLLLLIQVQFIPYHQFEITWAHSVAIIVDIILIWWLWRLIIAGRSDDRRWFSPTKWIMSFNAVLMTIAVIVFSLTIATLPTEGALDRWVYFATSPIFRPQTFWVFGQAEVKEKNLISLRDGLFAGEVDDITRRRKSAFSDSLILPGLNIYEALKIDDPQKLKWREHIFDLRGRDLTGAVLNGARLPKVDLYGAHVEGATLNEAHFEGAMFDLAYLEGASLDGAHLEGATLNEAHSGGCEVHFSAS